MAKNVLSTRSNRFRVIIMRKMWNKKPFSTSSPPHVNSILIRRWIKNFRLNRRRCCVWRIVFQFSLYNCKYFPILSQLIYALKSAIYCIICDVLMVMDFFLWNTKKKFLMHFFHVLVFFLNSQASSASAHGVGSASRGSVNAILPTRPPIKTTTDDTPDFDRSKVEQKQCFMKMSNIKASFAFRCR